mmetsp:Transcript_10037/g.20324  ORF Transcript_10037/g.20324 Transcript_10037/m.20324 type:complete len:135 (+) Transcript_10037:973-1377(+)
MRAVVQRVGQASCVGGGESVSIGKGLVALIGIAVGDTVEDAEYLIKKILNLKFWASTDEDSARWQQSVTEIGGEILLVSQFTLFAVYKGVKPSFHRSMSPEDSRTMYHDLIDKVKAEYNPEMVKGEGTMEECMR